MVSPLTVSLLRLEAMIASSVVRCLSPCLRTLSLSLHGRVWFMPESVASIVEKSVNLHTQDALLQSIEALMSCFTDRHGSFPATDAM